MIQMGPPRPCNDKASSLQPQPWIQRKLTIGEPGDKYEREADRVASQVVQQINAPTSKENNIRQSIQREKDLEGAMYAKGFQAAIQRKQARVDGEALPDLEFAINSARGSGQPLDAGLQQSMGQAMGADFCGVRVHTDAKSDQLNQSIQARAFTTGQDVFFQSGAYQPGNREGQELIAHELTHVVQQMLSPSCQLSTNKATNSTTPSDSKEIHIKESQVLADFISRKWFTWDAEDKEWIPDFNLYYPQYSGSKDLELDKENKFCWWESLGRWIPLCCEPPQQIGEYDGQRVWVDESSSASGPGPVNTTNPTIPQRQGGKKRTADRTSNQDHERKRARTESKTASRDTEMADVDSSEQTIEKAAIEAMESMDANAIKGTQKWNDFYERCKEILESLKGEGYDWFEEEDDDEPIGMLLENVFKRLMTPAELINATKKGNYNEVVVKLPEDPTKSSKRKDKRMPILGVHLTEAVGEVLLKGANKSLENALSEWPNTLQIIEKAHSLGIKVYLRSQPPRLPSASQSSGETAEGQDIKTLVTWDIPREKRIKNVEQKESYVVLCGTNFYYPPQAATITTISLSHEGSMEQAKAWLESGEITFNYTSDAGGKQQFNQSNWDYRSTGLYAAEDENIYTNDAKEQIGLELAVKSEDIVIAAPFDLEAPTTYEKVTAMESLAPLLKAAQKLATEIFTAVKQKKSEPKMP
ncbi:eCIS core domain-containing protein [Acaryochloris marina NIES-2412]|uniref:eCIS core domain-containing protein n=1 Tax=Acaryochloris marina TaxID=155978 RepID=UPI004058F502